MLIEAAFIWNSFKISCNALQLSSLTWIWVIISLAFPCWCSLFLSFFISFPCKVDLSLHLVFCSLEQIFMYSFLSILITHVTYQLFLYLMIDSARGAGFWEFALLELPVSLIIFIIYHSIIFTVLYISLSTLATLLITF